MRRTRRVCYFAAAFTAIALQTAVTAVAASETTTVRILTSPNGSGPYNALATIQTHMPEFSDRLRLSVEETPGFHFNVKYLAHHPEEHANVVIGSGTVLDWAALTGQKPFYPEPQTSLSGLRTIAVMGLSYVTWVSTDPDVQEPEDFAGKRIGIGMLTQNEWGMYPRMLLDAWEITPKLNHLDSLGTYKNIRAMLDGRTEVGTLFGLTDVSGERTVVTGPHRELEASGRNWQYVSVPPSMIENYVQRTGAPFRIVRYAPETLPNQPEPLTTFGDVLVLEAHRSLPNDVAYELARVLVEHHEEIGRYNAFTRAWTPKTLAYGAADNPERFHPGALAAYKDLGVIDR